MGPHGSRAGVMAKDNQGGLSGWMQFIHELLKTEIYKRSQGRLVRQFTCLAVWIAFGLASYRMFEYLRVIQAQRAVAEARLEYTRSLAEAWKAAAELSGLLLEESWPDPPLPDEGK